MSSPVDARPLQSVSRRALWPALLAIGACSLIWQVASARAILSGLHGNELSLGLVLGSWLVLTGLGTGLVVCLPGRLAGSTWLTLVLALLPLGLLGSLALQHTLPAFASVGRVVGPGHGLLSALLCLLPCCLPLGAAFGLVALQGKGESTAARWASRLFVVESAGTVAAGLVFHLWLSRASLQAAAVVAGGACWTSAFVLVSRSRGIATVTAMSIGLLSLLYLTPGSPLPGAARLQPRLEGYQLLEQVSSPHAALVAARRGDQLSLWANGVLLFTNQDEEQVESWIHAALLAHPAPRRVLMIGGGLSGGISAALEHPVEQLDYVELDPQLVTLARRRRMAESLDDPRAHLLLADGRQVVRRCRAKYDVILVGMPGPTSALLNRYYTTDFFRQAHRALRPGGLLSVKLEGAESYLGQQQAMVHASVRAAMRHVFHNTTVLPGSATLVLAHRGERQDLRFVTLVQRMRRRGLRPRFFGEVELMDRTLPFKRERYLARLRQVPVLTNTDLHPALYFRASLTWLALTTPSVARGLGWLADALQGRPWVAPLAAFVVALLWGLVRRGCSARSARTPGEAPRLARSGRHQVAAGFAMGCAGLCGLAVELSLLLATQEARGVAYHEIGALLTAFMAGLALGAPLGRRLVQWRPARALQLTVTAAGLVAAVSVLTVVQAVGHPDGALPLLLVQMLAVGAAVGAVYPAASDALAWSRAESAAARAYTWDLVGAAVGALLASTIALPVLGLPGTCLTCAGLCLGVGATLALPKEG